MDSIIAHAEAPPRFPAHRALLLRQLDDCLVAALHTGWPVWHVKGATSWIAQIAKDYYYFGKGNYKHASWIDYSRGTACHDPGNEVLSGWLDELPEFERLTQAQDLAVRTRGNLVEAAAGLAFNASTGERFLVHLDMGRLHFCSWDSRDVEGAARRRAGPRGGP